MLAVAGGVALFFIGVLLIDSLFGADLADQLRRKSKSEGVLAVAYRTGGSGPPAGREPLLESHELLSKATVFVTRKDFAPSTAICN